MPKEDKSSTPSLAIRSQKRIRKQPSSSALDATDSRKKMRLRPNLSRNSSLRSLQSRPGMSRNSSAVSVKHLAVPATDDIAITSGDEADSVMGGSSLELKRLYRADEGGEILTERPAWTVRHRIYLDSNLISTTTATRRPGMYKFQDILLREQIELRLHTSHHGIDAHFATRHATLRFWNQDGTLAEKWMDKDYGGEKEHEFGLENMNDWTILHLSMGVEDVSEDGSQADEDMVDGSDAAPGDDETMDDSTNDTDAGISEIVSTMDIISHYITSYLTARNIASAPGVADEESEEEPAPSAVPSLPTADTDETIKAASPSDPNKPSLRRQNSVPVYHWVEDRRRSLEHQLRTHFHCSTSSCSNKGGTCLHLPLSSDVSSEEESHLPVSNKDLTDWSQQVAHAHRSVAAATLGLAAKLVDDKVREEVEDLAEEGRERDDEDDLGAVLGACGLLAGLRPAGAEGEIVDLEALD